MKPRNPEQDPMPVKGARMRPGVGLGSLLPAIAERHRDLAGGTCEPRAHQSTPDAAGTYWVLQPNGRIHRRKRRPDIEAMDAKLAKRQAAYAARKARESRLVALKALEALRPIPRG